MKSATEISESGRYHVLLWKETRRARSPAKVVSRGIKVVCLVLLAVVCGDIIWPGAASCVGEHLVRLRRAGSAKTVVGFHEEPL